MLLERVEVDEDWYVNTYPDVAAAIERAEISTATEHFRRWGYQEGRVPWPILFDEKWYRSKYPDVDLAIRAGGLVSGFRHFIQNGAAEGREYRECSDTRAAPNKAAASG